jgi:hypothetical protein
MAGSVLCLTFIKAALPLVRANDYVQLDVRIQYLAKKVDT